MSKIKICGLKRTEDILFVNQYKPDYIGFVFAGTKRFITDEQAALLKSSLDTDIKAVGVFVNEDIKHIEYLVTHNIIDMIQLHGDEDNDYINSIRSITDKEIIKAVRVKDESSVLASQIYNCDYLLFDTYAKDSYGGTGRTFDTSLLNEFRSNYFIAGGLNEQNLQTVLNDLNPYCVDLSSGVETDGWKDEEKIKNVIDIVRNYNLGHNICNSSAMR